MSIRYIDYIFIDTQIASHYQFPQLLEPCPLLKNIIPDFQSCREHRNTTYFFIMKNVVFGSANNEGTNQVLV
jgi:hypothetical protein